MTEQEAKGEAKKRWPDNPDYDATRIKLGRRAFVEGAEWKRSRVVVAAPSDTDREPGVVAMIHVKHDDGLTESWPIAERVPGGWQSGIMHYTDATVAKVVAVYTRTSRPVQVEVTNEMVERAARALGEFVTHGGVDDLSGPNGEYWIREARAVLSAALGGGE